MAEPEGDELVWHYTNTAGLLGILDDRTAKAWARDGGMTLADGAFSLRATDALYLNDPLELRYLRAEFRQEVAERMADAAIDNAEIDAVLDWLDGSDDLVAATRDKTRQGTYVVCFSRDGDLLSQWRGYAGDRGYAIGFDKEALTKMLAKLTRDPNPSGEARFAPIEGSLVPYLRPVQYGPAAAQQVFDEILRKAILQPDASTAERIHWCQFALSFVKQKAYETEEEMRLVFFGQGRPLPGGIAAALRGESPPPAPTPPRQSSMEVPVEVEFRSGVLGVVPYVTLIYPRPDDDVPLLVKAVKVGPGDHIDLRQSAVVELLRQRGMEPDDVTVSRSEIEFRG